MSDLLYRNLDVRRLLFLIASLPVFVASVPTWAGDRDDWLHFGGGPGGAHYSSLDLIDRDNVGALTEVWRYRTGETERYPEHRPLSALNVTPILLPEAAGRSLVFCSAMNRVIALDPVTGEERWNHDPQIPIGPLRVAG